MQLQLIYYIDKPDYELITIITLHILLIYISFNIFINIYT